MKYKTSELSQMLDVSANTIRRFAEKGYLSPEVDKDNQYRHFGDKDVEKITYISKYRKIGFGHKEISDMLSSDVFHSMEIYAERMRELDEEIDRLKSLRHMIKDDIFMMKAIKDYGTDFFEMNSVHVKYISYKRGEIIRKGKNQQDVLHQFIYDLPEIEYAYIIRQEDILARNLVCEEVVTIRAKLADKRELDMTNEIIEDYPQKKSILKIMKVPLDFMNPDFPDDEQLKKRIFDDFLEYIESKGYCLDGDAIGVKVGFSKEDEGDMQYIILGMPVKEKDK